MENCFIFYKRLFENSLKFLSEALSGLKQVIIGSFYVSKNKYHSRSREKGCHFSLCAFVILLLTTLVIYYWLHNSHQEFQTVVLQGSSPSGEYTLAMKHIQDYLQKKLGEKVQFKIKYSAGSLQNIRDLNAGKAHISLMQEDVAHYFYHGNHSILQVAHRNIKAKSVSFFFWEYLFIIVRDDDKLQNLSD